MRNATHTKGPWRVGTDEGEDDMVFADDFMVADVDAPTRAQMRANAALIAAAPELLQSLRDLIADIDTGRLTLSRACGMEDRVSVRANCERALAALARAEGKS